MSTMRAIEALADRLGEPCSLDAPRDDADGGSLADAYCTDGGAGAVLVERGLDAQRAHEAMQRLPARLRAVLALRIVCDWKLDEVGAALGISRQRVYQLQTDALAIMREALAAAR